MDGDRLLKRLKDGSPIDTLVSDVKAYLAPVHKLKSKSSDDSKKCGGIALKMLRSCVQSITSLSLGSQHLASVMEVARTCYEGICAARSSLEIMPLSLEKVLFHIVLQLVNKTLLMDALSFADYLYAELITSQPQFAQADGMDNEFETIAKQAFNQLWKACGQIEKSTKTGTRHILVLNARQKALAFVMLTNQDTAWIANAALRAGVEMERYSGKDSSNSEHLSQFFSETVNGLLSSVERKSRKTQSVADMATTLGPVLEVCLQYSKYCLLTGRTEAAAGALTRIQALARCPKKQSPTTASSKLICAICDMISISLSFSSQNAGNKCKSKSTKSKQTNEENRDLWHQLQQSSNIIAKSLEIGDLDPPLYQSLVDTFVFLRKQVEGLMNKGQLQCSMYSTLYQSLAVNLDVLETYKEHVLTSFQHPTDVYRGLSVTAFTTRLVNKQLTTLNFMATITIQELNARKSGPETEDVKQDFGSRAITICKRTKAVMEDVSKGGGGVISVNEYRCLGSNAYNFGVICYKHGWYDFASHLVRMSCEQIQRWCSSEQGLDERKAQEIQLAKKYELLVDCQRRAGLHQDAMTTVALSLLVVPGLVIDDISSRVEQWVKAKRDALKIQDDSDLRNRTLLDACEEMDEELGTDQLSIVASALGEELKVYRSQRNDTCIEQYAAIQDLIRMYSSDGYEMERAAVLIQLAQLLYSSGLESERSPEAVCIQAVDILEGLTQENSGACLDLLAQAKFWLYVCQLETVIQNFNTSCSSSPDLNLDSSQESTVDASDGSPPPPPPCNLTQEAQQMTPLVASLEIWASLLQVDPFNPSYLQDPPATMRCLQLAADIMAASGKAVEEIWVLSMLSKLAHSTRASVQAIEADLHLSRLLAQVGLNEQAAMIIRRAEKTLDDVPDSKRTLFMSEVHLGKCYVFLYSRQIEQFEESFLEYLAKSSRMSGHRNCRTYLTSALAKELHSYYLSMPPTQRNPKHRNLILDEHGDEIIHIDLHVEAMRIRMGVAKIILGTGTSESGDQSYNDKPAASLSSTDGGQLSLRWRVLASVLDSLSNVAQGYTLQGCVREAQCYITEGISLAQKFQLPRRYGRLLQQLTEVQIKWGQEDECSANLTKLKAVLTMDNQLPKEKQSDARTKKTKKGGRPKMKTKQQKAVKNAEESDEEDFIKSRPMSFSRSLDGQISVDMSNSPSLRPAPVCSVKLPGYVDHQSGCICSQCTDISLHELETGYYLGLAGNYALVCNNEAALATLGIARELLEWSKGCLHEVFKEKLNLLNIQPFNFRWACHQTDLCKVVSMQAEVELELGIIEKALSSAKDGLALCELNCAPVDLVVQASFHCYLAIAGIQMKAINGGNSVFDSSWALVRNDTVGTSVDVDDVGDVACQFSQLSMSVTAKRSSSVKESKPSCRLFQNMLDTSSGRPEMTRKRDSRSSEQDAVLPEELGLLGDVIIDEADDTPVPVKGKHKASESRVKSAVQATTKKGAVNFTVAKKAARSSKKAVEVVDLTTPSDDADGVFSFDEETTCETKKPPKGRGRKGSKKAAVKSQDTTQESTDTIDPKDKGNLVKATKKGRGKGREASKSVEFQEAPVDDDNSEVLKILDEVIAEFSDTNPGKEDEAVDVKPKRGRGRKTKESSGDAAVKETKPRARRGRVPKGASGDIENTRGDPDPGDPDPGCPELLKLLHDDSMNESITIDTLPHSPSSSDVESSSILDLSLETFSPSKHQPEISVSDAAIQKKLRAAKNIHPRASSKGSESSIECTIPLVDMNTSSSSFLETQAELDLSIGKLLPDSQDDLDDIEIPRGGSDSEDTGKKGKRRGRGVKKSQITVWEDVEASRGCGKHLEEKKSRAGSKKPSKTEAELIDPQMASITDLMSIQEELEQAYNLIKHLAPCPLYRHVCQLLALCHGDRNPAECSRYLALASSVTLRHQKLSSLNKKLRKLRKASDKDDVSIVSSMGSLSLQSVKEEEERLRLVKKHFLPSADGGEDCIIKEVGNALPQDYTVCQLSVVSCKPSEVNSMTASSQLVITKIQKGHQPLVVRLPTNGGDGIVTTFERILAESKETVKETDKRVWWTTRQRLDEEMQGLTKDMENNLLSCWKGLLQGSYPDQKANNKLKTLGQRLSTSIQEAGQRDVNPILCECLVDSFHGLTHTQTNQALSSLTGLQPGSEDLTQLAMTLKEIAKEWEKFRPMQRNLVVLILDTAIQQLPWESIPVLQEWPVCRLPNLHFLLSHLRASESGTSILNKGVNPDKAYFVLNPTGDLDNTQKTFQDWFQKENKWKGVVGRAPSKPEYASALTDHDLFVFCGHGTGREFLTGDDIQRLTCKAATLLIGCSSGKLQVKGCLDASGMALNYLLAECPCVVANLWDVTDRDIDRYLEYLLKAWLASATKSSRTSDSQSLASLLNDARKACKLKHLIGFAPVLYGLPATMQVG